MDDPTTLRQELGKNSKNNVQINLEKQIQDSIAQFTLDCGITQPEQKINTYAEFAEVVKSGVDIPDTIYTTIENSNSSYKGIFLYRKWPSGIKNFMLHTLSDGKGDGELKVEVNLKSYFTSVYKLIQLLPSTVPLNINLVDTGDLPPLSQFYRLITSHQETKGLLNRINDCHGGINMVAPPMGTVTMLNGFLKIWSTFHNKQVNLHALKSINILEGQHALHDLNLEKKKFWNQDNL
jgi:hypothetical protein